jgi:hypothetical protein
MQRTCFAFVGILTAVTLFGEGSVARATAKPAARVKVKRGYLDAHFAVGPKGKYLVYLHVLSNKKAFLTVGRLRSKKIKKIARRNIAQHTLMPEKMRFTPDGKHVLLVWRADPAKPDGPLTGALFDKNARLKSKVGPFEDLRFRKQGSAWKVITYRRVSARSVVSHRVTVYSYPQLRAEKRYKLVTNRALQVSKPKMELVYFKDDYLRVVAKIAGRYDKAKDIRLPDKEAVYDMTQRKVIAERPIKDAIGWEKLRRFRQKHAAFDPVFVLQGSGENTKLVLVRKNGARFELGLGTRLDRFQEKSLKQQFLSKNKAVLSLSIDPQNPLALKKKRSEPEVFHLYYVKATPSLQAKPVLELPSKKLDLRWRYGKRVLAVMPLHENWGLGGPELRVYRIALPQ